MIFANLANSAAASSLVKFVATAKSAIVLVNSVIFPVSIPNCPADSAIADSSAADVGISFAICLRSSRICIISTSDASTVFLTPAKADSNSEPTDTASPSPVVMPRPAAEANPAIALNDVLAISSNPVKNGFALFNPDCSSLRSEAGMSDDILAASAACLAISCSSFFVSLVLS